MTTAAQTFAEFQGQVESLAVSIGAIAEMPTANNAGAIAYAMGRQDYPLAVCDCVAAITGAETSFTRMFNREWRDAATQCAFDRARQSIAA